MVNLEFGGKGAIYTHHRTIPIRPLVTDRSKSLKPADDGNLIIHGDNLHALKALLPRYAGRISCIYIDPPYNTGNEGWVYNDNVNSPTMQRWLEGAREVDGEDLERHDKWLCMMWPRLQLLRELLAKDGVIFVSIDDNEVHRLRMMMDEVFGVRNFITQITWHKKRGKDNSAKFFSVVHDFVVTYAKEKQAATINLLPMDASTRNAYKNFDDDPRGSYRLLGLWSRQQGGSSFAFTTKTGEHFPERLWLVNREKMKSLDSDNRLVTKGDKLYRKLFLDEVNGSIPETMWTGLSNYANAKDEIKTLFGGAVFDTPKPVDLIDRIVRIATRSNDTILDSFAGSGTTAHAVLALNKEDGGNRKFILVECEDYADTITAERVRRVISGVPGAKDKALSEGTGGSFSYCTLGHPLDVDKMLAGEQLPDYHTLASHLLHTATGISVGKTLKPKKDGLFHSADGTDYYLLYRPNLEYLRSAEAVLDGKMAARIRKRKKRAMVFGAGKYMGQRELTHMNIEFCTIPIELLRR